MTRLRCSRARRLGLALCLGALLLGSLPQAARAQPVIPAAPYADAQRLIASGELALAQQRLEQWLQERPTDPQARLLLGVVLTNRGDTEGARQIYESLTQAYPELPEPYNNLAVLQAAQGRLPEARAALESAIRFNPDYATAHRNLGDVYAHLALGHWQRALTLQPDSPGLAERLRALRELLGAAPPR
ncbi:MAG: tetratricopeptide repeat protein [Tepidimonas sp.]|uniref:tetratricopeptide repeat protein n=1 Tax=Tepidimonas sp. TaxID=2002775 RepID=UPI00259E0B0D|nr:tetratricopeptide repeat protein [Tepidimonas sp.]MDM7457469.1 tetratricopeptide repeat protein [Tepidimonas sp.]